METWCNFAKIFPVSVVRVTRTARSARVIKATLDSGFDLRRKRSMISKLQVNDRCLYLVFEWVIRFTASCCACSLCDQSISFEVLKIKAHLVGRKSPFRMNCELSTHMMVDSRTISALFYLKMSHLGKALW